METRQRVKAAEAFAIALLVGVALFVLLVGTVAFGQEAPSALPPLEAALVDAHVLRVENAQLRASLAQLRAELDSARLSAERTQLEQQLRATLKPPAGHIFDWTTKQFAPPQEPAK